MAFADAGGDFMQVVVSDISNVAVELLNLAVLLFPVFTEFYFFRQTTLQLGKFYLIGFKAVLRFNVLTV